MSTTSAARSATPLRCPLVTTVTVAIDGSPLLGPLTGIGAAVGQMITAIGERDDVVLHPYALSMRGRLRPGMVRLPLPAAVAQWMWARADFPRLDWRLRPASVLHGTNYAVGPSHLPRVVSVYDCWFLRNREQASPVVDRVGRVLRRAVAGGAVVHASSHATADAVRELLNTERIEVIPLAALPLPTAPSDDKPAPIAELAGLPYILSIGTLEKRKNLPALIAAFAQMAAPHEDLRLVLAGADGDDRLAIDTALDALPPALRERVMRTDRIDDAVKHWLLANAQVLAYPSLDEGFGFPLLEAMQYKLPVVASTRGSIPEVAGDAALLIDPLDRTALAAALNIALTDSAERDRLVRNGTARVAAFSWAQTAEQLAALYHRLAGEGSR
jgi:glycosyltransferase involved in cell wall biosynthesis